MMHVPANLHVCDHVAETHGDVVMDFHRVVVEGERFVDNRAAADPVEIDLLGVHAAGGVGIGQFAVHQCIERGRVCGQHGGLATALEFADFVFGAHIPISLVELICG